MYEKGVKDRELTVSEPNLGEETRVYHDSRKEIVNESITVSNSMTVGTDCCQIQDRMSNYCNEEISLKDLRTLSLTVTTRMGMSIK